MIQGGSSTQRDFLKPMPQYSVLGLDSGVFFWNHSRQKPIRDQKSHPSPYYPAVGFPELERELLNAEHVSGEFFIWKQSKEMHGEQRLQKHSPNTSPWLEGRLFSMSHFCVHFCLSSVGPGCCPSLGKNKKAVFSRAGGHFKHGLLCCL